ncbi:MAG: PLDc N-terminal domain-containing protein [Elusimicrobiota bacterium]
MEFLDYIRDLINATHFLGPFFLILGGFSVIFFIAGLILWFYAFYTCFKTENDRVKRNIWLAIILIGKFAGAISYLVFEKILSKKESKISE